MRIRPVLASAAALSLLTGALVPALAAVQGGSDAPAAGAATSSLTLLDVGLGGRRLSVLQLALRSDILAGAPTTSLVVTPLTADGTAYGRQSATGRSAVVPAADSAASAPGALSAVATARSPRIDVRSDRGTSRVGATSLGDLSVLGLPLAADGTLSLSSAVDGTGAAGDKTLRVSRLALPSVSDLLAALGLDLRAVPTASLTDLTSRLDLDSTSIRQAQAVLDGVLAPVRPQVDAAEALVASADAAVEAADAQVATAQAELAGAVTTLNDATRALTGTVSGLRVGSLAARSARLSGAATLVSPSPTLLSGTGEVALTPAPVADPAAAVLPPAPVVGTLDPVLSPAPAASTVSPTPATSPSPSSRTEDVVERTLAPVLGTGTAPLSPVVGGTTAVVEQVLPLPELVMTPELQPLLDAHATATAAYDSALAAVGTAQATVATATALLTDAVAALDALLAPYAAQIDALVDAVVGVLDATPLVSLDRLEVTTRSAVTSAGTGGQVAEIVGGEVGGLRVLGTDVLQTAVGTSEVALLDLAGPVTTKLDAVVAGLTGTLSSVLSDVPGLPRLEVPAPKVELLKRATATDAVNGYGVAGTALRALTVSWPGITLPAAAALPGAATLPAVTGLPALPTSGLLRASAAPTAAADLLTQPLTVSLATLEDRARFRPAGAGTPGTTTPEVATPGTTAGSTPPGTTNPATAAGSTAGTDALGTGAPRTAPAGLTELPRTGGTPGAIALLLVGAALGLHRRYRTV